MTMFQSGARRSLGRARPSAATLALAGLAVAAALVGACGGDEPTADDAGTSTTEDSVSSSVADAEDDSTATSVVVRPGEALWPLPGSDASYDDPIDAVRDFAVDLVGFVEPVVGGLVETETDRGTVEVRPVDGGPVTAVAVHRVDGGAWVVESAASGEIVVDAPAAGDEVADPVALRGTSTAFEGTVQVTVRDDDAAPLGSGFVTGGANGEMGPFSGEVAVDIGGASGGSVALYTLSMEDGGGVLAATVVPVAFGG